MSGSHGVRPPSQFATIEPRLEDGLAAGSVGAVEGLRPFFSRESPAVLVLVSVP
jgi:hypothetical protein